MERWMLGALLTIALLLAGAWGSAVHSQLSEIKGSLATIAASNSATATLLAVHELRLKQLEGAKRQ